MRYAKNTEATASKAAMPMSALNLTESLVDPVDGAGVAAPLPVGDEAAEPPDAADGAAPPCTMVVGSSVAVPVGIMVIPVAGATEEI